MSPTRRDPDPDLIVAHVAFVRGLARELVFDAELARDVEQEVLLAALENAPREPRSIRAWLAAIVRNVAYKAFRARSRREARERQATSEGVPTPAEILAREDLRRALVEHVLALDAPLRDALVLRFFEELPPREVARRLGIPLETARSRIKRGLHLLRERLESGGGRGTWCLALVTGLKVEPPSLLLAGVSILGASLPGVIAMGVSKKASVAAALLVLASMAWVALESSRPAWPTEPPAPTPRASGLRAPATGLPAASSGEERRTAVAGPSAAEPAAPTPTATTGAVLLSVRWFDGTPAAGVTARIHHAAGDFYADTSEVTTGADGTCLVAALPPGRITVSLDRDDGQGCEIVAGERAAVEITIPRGFDVSGRVVERGGRPVAGADILLDRGGAGWPGFVVARSDAAGRYTIRSVDEGIAWVSARAALHAPSAQREVIGGTAGVEDVELVLEPAGAGLEGIVHGHDGQPLARARLLVGAEDSTGRFRFEDGGRGREPAAQAVECDERGRFVVAGVPVGSVPVQARGAGHAPWSGLAETLDQRSTFLEIRLVQGTSLTGRVSDDAGTPVARAEIHGNGRYDFAARYALSAADGTFTLHGLPAHAFEVAVEKDGHAGVETTLVGAPGAELTWNPVLGSGLTIRGRLVLAGTDFSQWSIRSESQGSGQSPAQAYVRPSADGTFAIGGCADVAHELAVHPPGSSWFFPVAERKDVRPGEPEVVIAIEREALATCRLRGRIVDDSGEPLAGASYTVGRAGQSTAPILSAAADGTFDAGPYPPGTYTIGVQATGFAPFASAPAAVAAGSTWDFGDLLLQRGGRIAVHLARDPALAGAELLLRAYAPGTRRSWWFGVRGDEAGSEALAPGEYVVELRGGDALAWRSVRATVRAGEQTMVTLPVEVGVRLSLVTPAIRTLELEAADATGTTLWESGPSPPSELALPATTARLRAADAGGRRAELELAGTGPWSWTVELR